MNVGSIPYMAPEQLAQRDDYTVPVDMWAVGCTMFFMMTRKLLCPDYEEETRKEMGGESDPDDLESKIQLNSILIRKTLKYQLSIFGMETFQKEQILSMDEILNLGEASGLQFTGLEAVLDSSLKEAKEAGMSFSPQAKDLLINLLNLSPNKRMHAKVALEHDWFKLPENKLQ